VIDRVYSCSVCSMLCMQSC